MPSSVIDAATSVAMYEPPTTTTRSALVELVAQLVGVAERADVVDAVAHPAVDLQAADARAGGDERLPEADAARGRASPSSPSVSRSMTGVRVRTSTSCSAYQASGWMSVDGAVLAALQVALRQRRAVVGRVHLAGDEQDRALEAPLAQLGGGVRRGDAAADQQDVDRRRRSPRGPRRCRRPTSCRRGSSISMPRNVSATSSSSALSSSASSCAATYWWIDVTGRSSA